MLRKAWLVLSPILFHLVSSKCQDHFSFFFCNVNYICTIRKVRFDRSLICVVLQFDRISKIIYKGKKNWWNCNINDSWNSFGKNVVRVIPFNLSVNSCLFLTKCFYYHVVFFFFLDKENICFWVVFEFTYMHTWKSKVTTQKNNLKRNRLPINPITCDNTNFDRFSDNENKIMIYFILRVND